MKLELGESFEMTEARSPLPEGFDPNARVEAGGDRQPNELGHASVDFDGRSERVDVAEDDSTSSDADASGLEHSKAEGSAALDKLFSKLEDLNNDMREPHEVDSWDWVDKLYTSIEDRLKRVAYTDAELIGAPTDFLMRPNPETLRGQEVSQKMREFGVNEIRCVKGVVDFSPVSVAQATIEGMTSELSHNRRLGFKAFAEQFNKEGRPPHGEQWNASRVGEFAHNNGLEFHECSDMRTVQLVPAAIHQYFKHLGGRKECSIRDGEKVVGMGGFDD